MKHHKKNIEYFHVQESRGRGQCGKICFDKRTAQTKKNFLEKIGKEKKLRIYSCPECNYWHLTKKLDFY